jgi:hypothetical protein
MREEALAEQVTDLLQKVSIPKTITESMIADIEREKEDDHAQCKQIAQNLRKEIESMQNKLDTLLDAHLEGVISQDEYTAKKQKLLDKKVSLVEKLKDFERKGHDTLEPLRQFIFRAQYNETVALQRNFSEMKNFLKNLHSNRRLEQQMAVVEFEGAWKILFDFNSFLLSGHKNPDSISAPCGGANAQYTYWLPN